MTPVPLPWMLLGILLAILAAGGAGYWQGGKHKADELAARAAREDRVRAETREVAMQAAAEAIGQIEIRNVTIRQKAETVTREVPVYRECNHSADGLQLVNSALAGQQPRPADRRQLPPADPPDG